MSFLLPRFPSHIRDSAELLVVMSSPKRIHILELLTAGEMSVGDIVEKIGVSQSATSQHLAKLRDCRLVKSRRDAQTVFYHSDSPAVLKILEVLREIFQNKAEFASEVAA